MPCVGAVNELIEFAAVAGFGTDGVGDYFNNALVTVFNALGAFAACACPTPRGGARVRALSLNHI